MLGLGLGLGLGLTKTIVINLKKTIVAQFFKLLFCVFACYRIKHGLHGITENMVLCVQMA